MNQSVPLTLYGSSISYFTGKMEVYFRLKRIPYTFKPLTHPGLAKEIANKVGSSQMPAVQLPDGQWMTDSTAMIQWFEEQHQTPALIPINPVIQFFSLLLEDYADEWLWRPAMHYRWHYPVGAHFAGTHLAHELPVNMPAPIFMKRFAITRRQRKGFTRGDGVTKSNVTQVEAIYLNTLKHLEAILANQAFMLGDQPSLVDVGFSGPFLRHFGLDPVPAEIMRQQAPAVYEWLARLWNYSFSEAQEDVAEFPPTWSGLLRDVADHYLPYLNANVDAIKSGKSRFDVEVGGVQYRKARASTYRVTCLQKLRSNFESLPPEAQLEARELMQKHGLWQPLWEINELPAAPGTSDQLPFHTNSNMLDVY